jgi:hypothetical protein
MGSITTLILAFILVSVNAFAKSEIVSHASHANTLFKVDADLYYDKDAKKADLWINFYQGPASDKVEFRASSLPEQWRDTQVRLSANPASRQGDMILQTFDGYEPDGKFNANRGFALHFKQPIVALPKDTLMMILKNFPDSVAFDEKHQPKYVKCLLTRVTAYRVYPIAAFDVGELELSSSQ